MDVVLCAEKSALHGRWTMESGRIMDAGCRVRGCMCVTYVCCTGGDVGWRMDDGECRMVDDG